jgi:hypothetical protein
LGFIKSDVKCICRYLTSRVLQSTSPSTCYTVISQSLIFP